MSIFRQDDPPEVMRKNDRWVDTFDENKIYVCTSDYDLRSLFADLLVGDSFRPGSVGLTFVALVAGNAGRNIKVKITHAGTTGVSSLLKSGAGSRIDPYIYDFQMYDNENSNDRIIQLLSSDTHLSVSGSDADIADLIPIALTPLDNTLFNHLFLHNISVVYNARAERLLSVNSSIPRWMPHILKTSLAEYLASRLSAMDEGGDPSKAQKWETMWQHNLLKARQDRHASSYPQNDSVRPG